MGIVDFTSSLAKHETAGRCAAVARVCAIVVGIVFILAAVEKAAAPKATMLAMESLVSVMSGSQLRLTIATSVLPLSMIELALGAALFAGVAQRVAAWVAVVFIAGASAAAIVLDRTQPEHPCGCGLSWLTLGYSIGIWGIILRNCMLSALLVPSLARQNA